MSKALVASTTVTFEDPENAGRDIRLEQDTRRRTESKVYHTFPYRVTAQNVTHVRLYHGPRVTPSVSAITGSISYVSTDTAFGLTETLTLTPDSQTANVPSWATNLSYRVVGIALSPSGAMVGVSLSYDPERFTITSSAKVFAAVEITYDAPYKLYSYTFSGTCPVNPPKDFDDTGSVIEREPPPNFRDGVVFAIDFTKSVHATLTMSGPACSWGGVGGVRGTESGRVLPKLSMDIHPDYPPRLVSSADGVRVWCECTIRVFPAGSGATVLTTSGYATSTTVIETMQVRDILLYENRSSQSLSYTPVGSVALVAETLYPVDDRRRRFYEGRSVTPAGPGFVVTDVDISDDGMSYTNPRDRALGPAEVALVDIFRIPAASLAVITADYITSFDCFTFMFDWDGSEKRFKEAILLARTEDGRVARLEVSPPSTKARNRRFSA